MVTYHEDERGFSPANDPWQKPGGTALPERRVTRAPNAGDAVVGLLGLVLLASLIGAATSNPRTARSHHATIEPPAARACSSREEAARDMAPGSPPEPWAFVAVVLVVAVVFLLGWTAASCAAATGGVDSGRHTGVTQVESTR